MNQMKIITSASVLLFALFLASCGAKPDGVPKYQAYYAQAHAFMEKNEPGKAIPLYKKAIKAKRNFAQAYHEIAVCYQQVGKDSAAIENYEGSIVFNPRDVDAYQSVGNIYFMQQNMEEARSWYDKATMIDYLYPRSYNNLATIYYMRGDYKFAKKYWDLAITVDATYPRAYYGLGLVAMLTGDSTEAESKFLDAVKVGSMPEAIYMLGTLNYNQGKYDDAVSWFNRYLEKAPDGEWANKVKDMLVIIGQKKSKP
jgi:tetratricopeptide (TPR) repeat protein